MLSGVCCVTQMMGNKLWRWLGAQCPNQKVDKCVSSLNNSPCLASQCHRSIWLKIMATSDYLRVIAFAVFTTFSFAFELGSSLNPFSESVFRNGNSSTEIVPRTLPFAHLSSRQLQCENPGWCKILNRFAPQYHLVADYH
jgi:hypothetical protein